MTFKEFVAELNGERVEGELVRTLAYSLLTGLIVLGILYSFKFRFIENFIPKLGFFMFFAVLSYAVLTPVVRHIRAYCEMPCMSGMMVGMTTGMIGGFLPGFFVASTNGMFVGGMFGIGVGMILGVWNGKCCGVMGFLEGIMAGFMGGLMGAMTAFMLFNDNLKAAAVIVFLVSAVILSSLNYMIYKEMKHEEHKRKEDHLFTVVLTFILVVATIWLMAYGPRSGGFG